MEQRTGIALVLAILVGLAQGYDPRPSIPTAWNATMTARLVNFFPFTATVMQDREHGQTRLDLVLNQGPTGNASLVFDLVAGTGFLFAVPSSSDPRPPACQHIELTPKTINLLSWTYYDKADMCGTSCWQYVAPTDNEKYMWIFMGQPPVLFSFEVNPLHQGTSSLISVLSNVQAGPQDPNVFVVPSFCRTHQQRTQSNAATHDGLSLVHHVLSTLA